MYFYFKITIYKSKLQKKVWDTLLYSFKHENCVSIKEVRDCIFELKTTRMQQYQEFNKNVLTNKIVPSWTAINNNNLKLFGFQPKTSSSQSLSTTTLLKKNNKIVLNLLIYSQAWKGKNLIFSDVIHAIILQHCRKTILHFDLVQNMISYCLYLSIKPLHYKFILEIFSQ